MFAGSDKWKYLTFETRDVRIGLRLLQSGLRSVQHLSKVGHRQPKELGHFPPMRRLCVSALQPQGTLSL